MKKTKASSQGQFPATETKVEASPIMKSIETGTLEIKAPETPPSPLVDIKTKIKELFGKVEERKTLQSQVAAANIKIEAIDKELAEYDIRPDISVSTPATTETSKTTRIKHPTCNLETVAEFIKGAGGKGRKGAEMLEQFGQGGWNKFKSENKTKLRFDPDGTSKIWFIK